MFFIWQKRGSIYCNLQGNMIPFQTTHGLQSWCTYVYLKSIKSNHLLPLSSLVAKISASFSSLSLSLSTSITDSNAVLSLGAISRRNKNTSIWSGIGSSFCDSAASRVDFPVSEIQLLIQATVISMILTEETMQLSYFANQNQCLNSKGLPYHK